jgi:sulfatase modifying factor 1
MELHYTWQFSNLLAPFLRFLHNSNFFAPSIYLSLMTIPALGLCAWTLWRVRAGYSGRTTSTFVLILKCAGYFFLSWMAMSSLAAGFKTMIVEELAYQQREWFEPYLPALHFCIASAFLVDLVLVGKPIIGCSRLLAAAYLQLALLGGYAGAIYRVFNEDAEGAVGGIVLLAFFIYRNYVLAMRLQRGRFAIRNSDLAFLPPSLLPRARRLLYILPALGIVLSVFFTPHHQSQSGLSVVAASGLPEPAAKQPLGVEPEMVRIPAGEFLMGSNDLTRAERPVHYVFLDEYSIGRLEVTNFQYKVFCDSTKRTYPEVHWSLHSHKADPYFLAEPTYPVVSVNWDDALAYTEWLSQMTGKKYRLPTEAEWEKAARGGLEGKRYPWGDASYDADGKYRANAGSDAENDRIRKKDGFLYAAPVGSFPPNGYGLYDMAGNVWEWCADFYDPTYYARSPYKNPQGPEHGKKRVIRGGSWFGDAQHMENAARLWNYASIRYASTGFRVAMTP